MAIPASISSSSHFVRGATAMNDYDIETGQMVVPQKHSDLLDLKFKDLNYKVEIKYTRNGLLRPGFIGNGNPSVCEKQILYDLNGSIKAGQMLAIMGPSGSGKTTVLNVLNGRIQQGCTGKITYRGITYNKEIKRRIGFVSQHDIVYQHLTVRETVVYSALLKLPACMSRDEKINKANAVISRLQLQRCQDTMMGGTFVRGVSGGERKRTCIGIEMLTEPSIMFLDEPTSGLDSTIALRIIEILKGLSNLGVIIVATIHQPSTRVFNMFDKLMLLSEGHCAYMGEAEFAKTHFVDIGFQPHCKMSPPEFFLDLCSGHTTGIIIPEALEKKINDLVHDFQYNKSLGRTCADQMSLKKFLEKEVRKFVRDAYTHDPELEEENPSQEKGPLPSAEFGASWLTQFQVLFCRGLKERRHEYLNLRKLIEIISLAAISGFVWFRSDSSTDPNLMDQMGLFFYIVMMWSIFPMYQALFLFPQDRAMLAKERANEMYSLSAYFMARVLGDVPLDFCLATIFIGILAPMAHMRGGLAFFLRLFCLYLVVLASQGMGLLVGAAVVDETKASSLGTILLTLMMLVAGTFVQNIPKFISWLKYLSLQHYGYELMVKIEYAPEMSSDCGANGCLKLGGAPELIRYNLNGGSIEALGLLAIAVLCRFFAYLFLRFRKQSPPY